MHLPRLLLGATLCLAAASCDDANVVDCGPGALRRQLGHVYCVYEPGAVPSGAFDCPARTPNKVLVGDGFVCTDDLGAAGPGDIPADACGGSALADACGVAPMDAGPERDADTTDAAAPDGTAVDGGGEVVPCADPDPGAPVCSGPTECGVVDIAAGGEHTCVVLANGAVLCWGENHHGQLGDGTRCDGGSAVPRPVEGDLRAVAVVAGVSHTCVLDADGAVYCWGDGGNGQVGPSGIGAGSATPLRIEIDGASAMRSLAAGSLHTCALANDGASVWCWGIATSGELGRAAPMGLSARPVAVTGIPAGTAIASIAAGSSHTCAVDDEGVAYCWGANDSAQLGLGVADADVHPAAERALVLDGLVVSEMAAGGGHTCARLAGSEVRCWGACAVGQCGRDPATLTGDPPMTATVPVSVDAPMALDAPYALVAASDRSCVLRSDDQLLCWGADFNGELGRGRLTSISESYLAAPVVDPDGSTELRGARRTDVGTRHVCALVGDDVLCWGSNAVGQLGAEVDGYAAAPVRVERLPR